MTEQALKDPGWQVLVIWGCEINEGIDNLLITFNAAVKKIRARSPMLDISRNFSLFTETKTRNTLKENLRNG
jgi:G:T-mismatch repair DNA endonuclease (very short patch repair protein)